VTGRAAVVAMIDMHYNYTVSFQKIIVSVFSGIHVDQKICAKEI
jgi:hypothetical protein